MCGGAQPRAWPTGYSKAEAGLSPGDKFRLMDFRSWPIPDTIARDAMTTDTTDDKRSPSGRRPAGKETGILTEQADLTRPTSPAPAGQDQEEQVLLPHERDQTTRPTGTGEPTQHEPSREKIGQAGKDTRRGLKDTDRRGIPSDIEATDTPPADATLEELAQGKDGGKNGRKN